MRLPPKGVGRVGETLANAWAERRWLGKKVEASQARRDMSCTPPPLPLLPLRHPLSSYSCLLSCFCSHVSHARCMCEIRTRVKYTPFSLLPPPAPPNKLTRAALIRQTLRYRGVCVCERVVSAKSTLGSRQVLGKILADAQLSSWLMNEQASSVTAGIWDRSRVTPRSRFNSRSRFPIFHDDGSSSMDGSLVYPHPRSAFQVFSTLLPPPLFTFPRNSHR